MNMIRKNLHITRKQDADVTNVSNEIGISFAEFVRRCIDAGLEKETRQRGQSASRRVVKKVEKVTLPPT